MHDTKLLWFYIEDIKDIYNLPTLWNTLLWYLSSFHKHYSNKKTLSSLLKDVQNCSAHIPMHLLKSMLVHSQLWFELALVSLCSQRSSVVHMHVDPSCLLPHYSGFEHSFWIVPPSSPSLVSTGYVIPVWQVPIFPSVWGLMAGLPGFASPGSSNI